MDLIDTAKALYEALSKKDNQPNVITVATFKEFEPLFRFHANPKTLSENEKAQINYLTSRYAMLIDVYKETCIIKSNEDRTIVVTLPPIMVALKPLSNTHENVNTTQAYNNLVNQPIEKYKAQAYVKLMNLVIFEQANNKTNLYKAKEQFDKLTQEFNQLYHKEPSPVAEPADKSSSGEWEEE